MITLNKIRELINKSENPLIFFDDDPDGLVSYLLIKKHFEKGVGIVTKGKPFLDQGYLLSVERYNPDLIIVLDKPGIEQDFVNGVNVPIVWIDHHPVLDVKGVKYYNPRIRNKNDYRPVSYWCYRLSNDNLWLAVVGIVADFQKPKFIKKFIKEYPELLDEDKEQEEILFNSNLGKLIKIFSFLLKGKSSDVKKNIEIINKIKDPYDLIYGRTEDAKIILKKIEKTEKEYNRLLDKAVNGNKGNKIVMFIYHDIKMSFNAEISNELMYKFPGKFVVVGREKDGYIRMSLRSPCNKKIKLPKIIEKALIGVDGTGGGHDFAVGANVKKEHFERFIEVIKKEVLEHS